MPESVAANSLGQIAWFAILSLIYSYMNYKLLTSADPAETATMRTTYFSIYLLLSVIGQYFITLGVSASLCGSPQYYASTVAVLFPWAFIFGVMVMMLELFPSWLAPFSNTIGYLVISMSGLSALVRKIFRPAVQEEGVGDAGLTGAQAKALSHIYADQSMLINQVTPANFGQFWNDMGTLREQPNDETPALKKSLEHLVILKQSVSYFIWYALTGALVISVSYNYLVNTACTATLGQIEREQTNSAEAAKTAATDAAHEPNYILDE